MFTFKQVKSKGKGDDCWYWKGEDHCLTACCTCGAFEAKGSTPAKPSMVIDEISTEKVKNAAVSMMALVLILIV